ncbi:MAG: peptidoglycan bridge formation glycyltransferase FemA/FemB family protein [Chloroflexota bacterium]|nr:peptidoglycan bridge formation glycyltransferase FemA/FemB family protein [Chloroflexota bacterium]
MHLHRARAPGGAEDRGAGGGRGGRDRIEARPASAADDAAWDDLVLATSRGHFLQTRGWALAKSLTGWTARRFVIDGGGAAQVLVKTLPLGITLAYCPRGPLVADEALPDAIVALRRALGRAGRCAALLCDPEAPPSLRGPLARAGVAVAPVHVQPGRTLILDPSREPEELLGAMRKKTRQYIHKAERAGVATEETTDLARFHRLLRVVGERDGFAIHSLAYLERLRDGLGDGLHTLMATVGGEDVGGLMLARMRDRAWELYGGWSGTHAEDRPFYLLKWRALQRMRQLGVTRYDMWGLTERGSEDDALAGVEQFKLGFGGEVVEFVGALETPVDRALFPLWQLVGRSRLARAAT